MAWLPIVLVLHSLHRFIIVHTRYVVIIVLVITSFQTQLVPVFFIIIVVVDMWQLSWEEDPARNPSFSVSFSIDACSERFVRSAHECTPPWHHTSYTIADWNRTWWGNREESRMCPVGFIVPCTRSVVMIHKWHKVNLSHHAVDNSHRDALRKYNYSEYNIRCQDFVSVGRSTDIQALHSRIARS